MSTTSNLSRSTHCKHLLITIALLLIILITSLIAYTPTARGDSSSLEIDSFFEPKTSIENAIHVNSEEELRTALQNAPTNQHTTIALDNDIMLTNGDVSVGGNRDVTLTSNRNSGFYKIIGATEEVYLPPDKGVSFRYRTITVGGVLRLDGVIVTHAKGVLGEGINVFESGTLILYDGGISGNTNPRSYMGHGHSEGGVGGVENHGVFVMFGGEITDNTSDSGSGVHNSGDFSMFGGAISNNNAKSGGGVCNSGDFSMFGGAISNNNAKNCGGGVYNMGVFSMFGGAISNNHATSGGGVYVNEYSGVFTMFDGVIAGNHAGDDGDNVWGVVKSVGGEIDGYTDIDMLFFIVCVVGFVIVVGVVGFLFLYFKPHKLVLDEK